LFVCFATKALHLEVVSDLTKDSFIAAFRRFVSRRGMPSRVLSDNGTTFVGARNELKELGDFLSREGPALGESAANMGVEWRFIPAYSPHFGGLWEAGVRAVKHHLKRVVGRANLLYEEFYTIITQIEGILNSRPLSPLSSDPNDYAPLTPAHFTIGRAYTTLPDPKLLHIPEGRLSNWQRVQQLQQHVWKRWSKEYISELQRVTKWRVPFPDLQEGRLVLLKDDSVPPANWRLGRISGVHRGNDNTVRVADVKTSTGTVRRALAKLCPLPI